MPKDNREKTASALKKAGLVAVLLVFVSGFVFGMLKQDGEVCDTNPSLKTSQIKVGTKTIEVEVVDNDANRNKGLSNRNCLDTDKGMLFVFDQPAPHCFWMNKMEFPIDIVWIGENKQITDIERGAQPDSYPHKFCPDNSAKYVLEVNKGISSENNWSIGTQLELSL